MATKPLTTETIALTEKKMDMTLDDIIKMSKVAPKGKKQQRRASNKAQNFVKGAAQDKPAKLRRFMDARSSIRQGVLAQRRSNFQGNQFPIAAEAARKAAVAPLRNRAFNRNRVPNWKARVGAPILQRRAGNVGYGTKLPLPQQQQQQLRQQENALPKQRPQTLDLLFANMKEQRMRAQPRQNNAVPRNIRGVQQRPPWGRGGRFGN
ncbi:hypothetical protein PRUPE_5G120800 [Prunus persica]|uniref:Uncharacterized protein n=1 Tax=Prunus persica TaxID=3760 RepID=M5WNF0_PRUPE|nr:uncharacterized protein LOC18776391 [Prunus persica]ONI07440.1 hypothetical protein PRUPE_5G120800 [Prunus persica]